MGLRDIWTKIKKGVKAANMAMKDDVYLNAKIIAMINDFSNSRKRHLMLEGERYYQVDNDIKDRKITKVVEGEVVEETYKANNKLAHAKYKSLVDEKIDYLLEKPYTLKCENEQYIKKVKDTLGKHFNYQISGLGYEASNKGIGWLQCYINEEGKFKMLIVPSEQCIPIWTDNSHTELEAMIKVYNTVTWEATTKKTITNVEYWTATSVEYYFLNSSILVPNYNKSTDEGGPVAHYKKGNEWLVWGKVPFVPFKNNRLELPDIKFVKSLVDNYDLSRSEAANYVEDTKNLIYILKGYGGENISDFMKHLNEDRAIPIDDPEAGGVDVLTPTMDITALREHYEQLKRDLIEDGQGVNKDFDKFGNSPSGIALGFMYAGLDLKCNALETQFKMGFESLLYFINMYISESGQGTYTNEDVDLVFNRNMKINESETIENCSKSKGIVSDDTIISNHPWVKDIEKEKEALLEQNQANLPFQDKVPINGGGANEE